MSSPRGVPGPIAAGPFRPYRIPNASGRDIEVCHPEVVQVGRTTPTIFTPLVDLPDAEGTWINFPLMLIESFKPLEVSARPANH